eukprot:gene9450-1692_t
MENASKSNDAQQCNNNSWDQGKAAALVAAQHPSHQRLFFRGCVCRGDGGARVAADCRQQ